jgi:hypothetical protein
MGCDIHVFPERRDSLGWVGIDLMPNEDGCPFGRRSYRVFGFLADVRNYSRVGPIAPRRGFPKDASGTVRDAYDYWDYDAHSASWLTLEELRAFDYDASCEDRRVTKQIGPNTFDGGCTCEPREGEMMTYRKFLGPSFFLDLAWLERIGAERIVFWFDN